MNIVSKCVRHVVRKTLYWIVTDSAIVQTRSDLKDGDRVYVYVGLDGQFYVRPVSEMIDGRFVNVR